MAQNRKPDDSKAGRESGGDKLSRFIVSLVTLLGALGLLALFYFPLHYLR